MAFSQRHFIVVNCHLNCWKRRATETIEVCDCELAPWALVQRYQISQPLGSVGVPTLLFTFRVLVQFNFRCPFPTHVSVNGLAESLESTSLSTNESPKVHKTSF
jgi:hypothetical protein